MKLISWNVNGIRAVLKKGFVDFVQEAQPDVLCLQEVRAQPEQVDLDLETYRQYWNAAEKKGYSGTLTMSRVEPLSVRMGISKPEHDAEGRVVTTELEDFFLVNVYTPNAQRGLGRLDYRTQAWEPDFLAFLKELEREKPVIFCGDLNVAHKEIDLANPRSNVKNAGFTPEERERMDRVIEAGFIDTFREFTQEGGHYTWWSQMGQARAKNIGWRIDYFLCSPALRPRIKRSYILPHVRGSDHCPIVLELD
ncbi:MAG TPA: exodeoxyribonuclease III [bacterium]|nr:exodeoxyribonuclease III [bacterium]